jgi:hypothetical protein
MAGKPGFIDNEERLKALSLAVTRWNDWRR